MHAGRFKPRPPTRVGSKLGPLGNHDLNKQQAGQQKSTRSPPQPSTRWPRLGFDKAGQTWRQHGRQPKQIPLFGCWLNVEARSKATGYEWPMGVVVGLTQPIQGIELAFAVPANDAPMAAGRRSRNRRIE